MFFFKTHHKIVRFVWTSEKAETCPPGYFGYLCKAKCVYPYYGKECQGHCDCSENLCDVSHGCQPVTEGMLYTNNNWLDSLVISTDFLNMCILVLKKHIIYRRNSVSY